MASALLHKYLNFAVNTTTGTCHSTNVNHNFNYSVMILMAILFISFWSKLLNTDQTNAFKKYFIKVAHDIQFSIRYSKNSFHDFLPPININSFFLNHTDKIEVKNIILFLNPSKSIGPNCILTKILKLLINDVSSQFT